MSEKPDFIRTQWGDYVPAAEVERWRALLKVYMRHVINCESVSFLDTAGPKFEGTAEQMDDLYKIEDEVDPPASSS